MTTAGPLDLRVAPFTVSDARVHGLRWRSLQTKDWRRLSRGQYVWSKVPDDTVLKLKATQQRLPPGFAFSGTTAAWLFGLDMACDPIEVTLPRQVPVRARAGIKIRRASLRASEITTRRGFPVTSALRTTCDLGSRRDPLECVVAIDAALHAGMLDSADLYRYVEMNTGAKGIRRLRRAVALADGRAESPMETRLRMDLVAARLPTPAVQVELQDRAGQFLARVDLFYPDARLVIEFDGQNHRDRLAADLRRQNALVNAGYQLLRFTAGDLAVRGAVAAQVRRARKLLLRNTR